ncbi:Aminopeptidase N [Pseudolycoriella hygida]|uniref:Aminopeptidase n=1 Tax=Pseudolycoriella hygida TaxID=35572 RepID=A0A9Q0S541_9DIPT|nr:Aminopeptidase N [Pseudolycoriella hygida]
MAKGIVRMFCVPSCLFFIIQILLTLADAQNVKVGVEQETISYRLPNETFPEHYEIHLTTNIHEGNFTFTGRVEITLVTREETSVIVVHARQLTITGVSLWNTLGTPTEIGTHPVEYDVVTEFVTVRLLNGVLESNQKFLLSIEYNGELREDNLGFYRSSYRDANDQLVWLAATQFAATNARHAFPCYDEPHIKATYEIYITHDSSYSALSNYPLFENIDNIDGSVTSRFCSCNIHQSIQFSSYIVGFVIAKFDYTISERTNEDDIEYRVYSRPEAVNNTKYALGLVKELLDVIQETVKVDYVLPKLYQVALPDFYFNAMENWGLITYREERLLFDEQSAPYTNRIENSRTMAHEVAHKWFGNLVTHNWWSFVWFKEGFARFFEQYAFGRIRPEWRIEDLFVLTDVQNALFTDSLFSTRQMTLYKESPSDILALYDNIAYAKGGSFLRMFYYVLGEEAFFRAVTELLNTAKFRATNEDELFGIFANATGESDLIDTMRSWTHQAGYPVVNVNRNYQDGTFTLTQRKFNLIPGDDAGTEDFAWSIPFNFFTGGKNESLVVTKGFFSEESDALTVEQSSQNWSSENWIILNHRETGFYRVNYDEPNWNLIISELNEGNFKFIPVMNRAQLIDDAFNLARANKLSYRIPFRLIEYLKNETDYIPWMTTLNALSHINRFYVTSENYELFKDYLTKLIDTLYNRVLLEDLQDEPIINKYARTLAINWGCELDLSWCKAFVIQTMNVHAIYGTVIEPNLRSAVYCSAVRYDSFYFSQLYLDFLSTKDQTERKLIINALGCSNHSTALEYNLLTIFNNTNFHLQEISPYFTSVYSGGPLGMMAVMKSIRSFMLRYSAEEINKKVGFGGIILGMAQRTTTEELRNEFAALLEEMLSFGLIGSSTVETAQKYVKMNSDWLIYSDAAIKDYLVNDYYGIGHATTNSRSYVSTFIILVSVLAIKAVF